MNMDFSLMKADRDLFAVYQTIYSGADIEMWFDWDRRLNDTKWTDECYFLLLGGKKVGGAVITKEQIMFPFLIPPFYDRITFWSAILQHSRREKINGVLRQDAEILPMFDYRVVTVNQVMCRPSDEISVKLADGFICRPIDFGKEAGEIAEVIVKSYEGGICNQINGAATLEEAASDAENVMNVYSHKNLSSLITEKSSGKIAAICLAGIGEGYTHGYAEIADLCVLPNFRGRGLAKYLIGSTVTNAHECATFVKLFMYVGNTAECLYRNMGFMPGPRFTNMETRIKLQ